MTARRFAMRWRCATPPSPCRNSSRWLKKYKAAICYAHHHDYPEFADITSDFVYARLQKGEEFHIPAAYKPADLDRWAARG